MFIADLERQMDILESSTVSTEKMTEQTTDKTSKNTVEKSEEKTVAALARALKDSRAELARLKATHAEDVAQREQVEKRLLEAQQLFQLVIDTLPLAVFWKDRHLNYLGCNQNFAEDGGMTFPDQLIGLSDYDMPWTREESDFFRACDRRVMLSNKAELGIIEPQMRDNGQQAWLETNKAPLHDASGNVIGILGTYQDITDRKEAETALHELNQKLAQQTVELTATLDQLKQSQLQLVQREKMSALGNLIAGIAHEMNNPLGFLSGNLRPAQNYARDILGLVELYRETFPEPGEEIEDELESIHYDYLRQDFPQLLGSMSEGIKRIRSISTSLRTFSRADAESKVAFELKKGLESTLLILKHRLKANSQRPAIEVVEDYAEMAPIVCYPGQLNQVFMNLLANAIDALEEDNLSRSFSELTDAPNQIAIRTEWLRDEAAVVIRIADNGTGMPDEVKQRVFENLFTTKAVGKGTGLGLAIVRQIIVDKHGGQITVNSAVGKGTEFVIRLPVLPEEIDSD